MQGKIIKGIAGFYYVNVVESGLLNVKQRGHSGRMALNHWLEMKWSWKSWMKKKKSEM